MADLKISQLTNATTPLAGTEVLPIVQSGSTVKATVANLTAGRIVSNLASVSTGANGAVVGATDGLVTDFSGGNSRIFASRNGVSASDLQIWITDALGSATNTFSFTSTGNIKVNTSGNGIDFSATPGTGTSELLADYEKGTFTPTVIGTTTAGTATYAFAVGNYVKVGDAVNFQIIISWSAGTGTGNLALGGLPFTAGGSFYSVSLGRVDALALTALNIATAYVSSSSTQIIFAQTPVGGGAASAVPYDANVDALFVSGTYIV
jgi:hypothetical protein